MARQIGIKHSQSGIMKQGFYGFSWTYLIFGWFVPLFRGELVVAALHLLFVIMTFGVSQLIFAFIYNRQYMGRMLTDGWVLDNHDGDLLEAKRALNIE